MRDYEADKELMKQTEVRSTVALKKTVVTLVYPHGSAEELHDLIVKGLPWYIKRCEELNTEKQILRTVLESAKEELENIIGYPAVEKLPFYQDMVDVLKEGE